MFEEMNYTYVLNIVDTDANANDDVGKGSLWRSCCLKQSRQPGLSDANYSAVNEEV